MMSLPLDLVAIPVADARHSLALYSEVLALRLEERH